MGIELNTDKNGHLSLSEVVETTEKVVDAKYGRALRVRLADGRGWVTSKDTHNGRVYMEAVEDSKDVTAPVSTEIDLTSSPAARVQADQSEEDKRAVMEAATLIALAKEEEERAKAAIGQAKAEE